MKRGGFKSFHDIGVLVQLLIDMIKRRLNL